MKKIGLLIVLIFAGLGLVKADNDRITTDVNELPANSREFLTKWFSDATIAHIKIEKKLMGGNEYEVLLTNGVDIEFDKEGEWKEIDGNGLLLPEEILPSVITNQLQTSYPGHSILKMEKKIRGWEVTLNNRLELTFDKSGTLIDIDD